MAEKMAFEKAMAAMDAMSPEKRKAKFKDMETMCLCAKCPTYRGTGEERLLFCLKEKSNIIKKENGCICMICPVQKSMAMRWSYYCARGAAKELAAKK